MIGTVEALGVFLLAVLPGFVARRAFEYGRPPFRSRGALQELGVMVAWSLLGWVVLYLWRGEELLPQVLDGLAGVAERIDAFAELVILAIAIGLALGLLARLATAGVRAYASRDEPGSLVSQVRSRGAWETVWARAGRGLGHALEARSLPPQAWDRLFTRLANERKPVLCRVRLGDGEEILGVLARDGFADWKEDGGDLLLFPEVISREGRLRPVPGSRGVFVPRDQIAVLSVVDLPAPLSSNDDG